MVSFNNRPHHKLHHELQPDRDFAILQHIVIPIQQILDTEDWLDRVQAGFSMALSHYTHPSLQIDSSPLPGDNKCRADTSQVCTFRQFGDYTVSPTVTTPHAYT